GAKVDGEFLTIGDRRTRTIVCPIGIDAAEFRALSESEAARKAYRRMIESADDRSMIVGVDRLDYSKGLEERFLGYERFLVEHPEERKEVFLLQIAPPSRGAVDSYQRIRARLEKLSGNINGAHADLDWVPIRTDNQGSTLNVPAGQIT